MSYSRYVGQRLRKVRSQKKYSLKGVEQASQGRIKASILGAYERGERSISLPRLKELSAFYKVPIDYFLADDEKPSKNLLSTTGGIRIDLSRLKELSSSKEIAPLMNYIDIIQKQRGDFNNEVITIRKDDIRMLSAIFENPPATLSTKLEEMGLIF